MLTALHRIQQHYQAIYQTQAPDVREFFVERRHLEEIVGSDIRHADEWVLVHQDGPNVDLAVYVSAEHLKHLQGAANPKAAVNECFRAFCAATEAVSHFVTLIERARRGEPISLLELEMQAEIDKYICARLHHPHLKRRWHHQLFRRCELATDLNQTESDRYREAGRLAEGLCSHLDTMPHIDALLTTARRFWRDSRANRMAQARRLAA